MNLVHEWMLSQHEGVSVNGTLGTMEERPNQLIAVVAWDSLEVSIIDTCKAIPQQIPITMFTVPGASRVHWASWSCSGRVPEASAEAPEGSR